MIDEDIVFDEDGEQALQWLKQDFPDVSVILKRTTRGYFCRLGLTARLPKCDATRIRPTIKEAINACKDLLRQEHPGTPIFPLGTRVEWRENWRCWGVIETVYDNVTYGVRWYNWVDSSDRDREFWSVELQPEGQRVASFPNDDMFVEAVWIHTAERLGMLKRCGAIYDYDSRGPVAEPVRFSVAELGENATMAHVMVALNLMPSLSQARKNGWDKPLELGVHSLTKKKILVEIVP